MDRSRQNNVIIEHKAFKYRIYPNKEQKIMFAKTFGCCRKIWNLMLNDKIAYYQTNKQLLKTTPASYKSMYPYLKEVDSLALANVQLNLETAYKNFFSGVKSKKKVGFPKYKSRNKSKRKYRTNYVNGNIVIGDNYIKLPKVGIVKANIHRKAPNNYVLKSINIEQTSSNEYYASVLYEYEVIITNVSKTTTNAIGLDYKSNGLYMDSNGHICNNDKWYRNSQPKLAKYQRKQSKKVYGSNNYYKAKLKTAKVYNKIKNQRLDFLHKESTRITNLVDVVCIEDLNMKSLSNKGFGNGKATLDNGYSLFTSMLEYKLERQGKYLIKVDKFYPSSQLCCKCGHKQAMPLEKRIYDCPNCKSSMDRDKNAAINILNEGLRILKTT